MNEQLKERLDYIFNEFKAANELKREIESKGTLDENDKEQLEIIEEFYKEFRAMADEWGTDYNREKQNVSEIEEPKQTIEETPKVEQTETKENDLSKISNNELEEELRKLKEEQQKLWRIAITTGEELSEEDKKRFDYLNKRIKEIEEEIKKRKENTETKENDLSKMSDNELEEELKKLKEEQQELWRMSTETGEELSEADKQRFEYLNKRIKEIEEEIKKRKENTETKENDLSKMSDNELEEELRKLKEEQQELWRMSTETGEELSEEDQKRFDYLNKRIKEIEKEIERRKEFEKEAITKLNWHPELTEEQILDAISRGIHEPVGQEYNQFLMEHGIKPEEKENEKTSPDPDPIPDPDPTPEDEEEKELENTSFIHFINTKVLKGTELEKRDDLKYSASNITVRNSYKSMTNKGNRLHNLISQAPAIISVPASFIAGLYGKIAYRGKTKERVETVKENLANLSEKDLEFLATHANSQELKDLQAFPTIILTLINERMQQYYDKKAEPYQEEVKKIYEEIFVKMNKLDEIESKLKDPSLTVEKRLELEKEKQSIIKDSCELIKKKEESNKKASKILGGEGARPLEENTRAMKTKNNLTGTSIAKRHDFKGEAKEKSEKLGELQSKYKNALANNNDEEALKAFVEHEKFKMENTVYKEGLLGKRSVGVFEYSPVTERLDYRNNTLIQDSLRAAMIVASAINVANSISSKYENLETAKAHNEHLTDVNKQNQQYHDQVQQSAKNIKGYEDEFQQGIETESHIINEANQELSHGALDRSHGYHTTGPSYRSADDALHAANHKSFDALKNGFAKASKDYQNGVISMEQYLEESMDLAMKSFGDFEKTIHHALPLYQNYNATTRFDLEGAIGNLKHIINNKNALDNMYKAIQGVQNEAEILSTLQIVPAQTLGELSDSVATSIAAAATVAINTAYANNMLQEKKPQTKYNDEVRKIVSEYIDKQEKEIEKEEQEEKILTENNEEQKEITKTSKKSKFIEGLKSLRDSIKRTSEKEISEQQKKELEEQLNEEIENTSNKKR